MELLKALLSLQLPLCHYAVFGSGPLIVRGIIDATNALGIISRGLDLEHLRRLEEFQPDHI